MDETTFNKFKDNIEKFTPLMPDQVIGYFMEKAGVNSCDENVKKYVSLVSQKFITDVCLSAMQHHKIFLKAAQKEKRLGKERHVTLQMEDLDKALKDHSVDISRPFYYM